MYMKLQSICILANKIY